MVSGIMSKQFIELLAGSLIHPGSRFIQYEDVRISGKGAR